jgi:hypothetical protein
MTSIIGTAFVSVDEEGAEEISFDFSADFLERSYPERIGSLYLLINSLYEVIDSSTMSDDEDEDEEEEEEEEDEDFFEEDLA